MSQHIEGKMINSAATSFSQIAFIFKKIFVCFSQSFDQTFIIVYTLNIIYDSQNLHLHKDFANNIRRTMIMIDRSALWRNK